MIFSSDYGRPSIEVDLLLKALICPLPEAKMAFEEWSSRRSFDDIHWEEMRILANLSSRMDVLAPNSSLRPRINGFSRHLWTRTQMLISASVDAFDVLDRVKIPFLVFKGAAFQSECTSSEMRRFFGDIDILVRKPDIATAFDALTSENWGSGTGESISALRRSLGKRIGVNLYKGDRGEIDLHSSAFHFSKIDPVADNELWSKSRKVQFFQKHIHIPDVENSIVIMLAHSPFTKSGDWVVEIIERIRTQPIDWNYLAWLFRARGIQTLAKYRFAYMRDHLNVKLPPDADVILADRSATLPEYLKCYSMLARRDERRALDVLFIRGLADLTLRRKSYDFETRGSQRRGAYRPLKKFHLPRRISLTASKFEKMSTENCVVHFDQYQNERFLDVELNIKLVAVRRSLFFEVRYDDLSVALLRVKQNGLSTGTRKFLFRIDLSQNKIITPIFSIVSVSNAPIRFDSSDESRSLNDSSEFSVSNAYLCR